MDKCILFDCDGTLVDSERLSNIGLEMQFRTLGIKLDADELVMRFKGWKFSAMIDTLTTEYQISLPDDFHTNFRSTVADLFERDLKPIDNIVDALKVLDHSKAVVSNGPLVKMQQALRLCGLTDFFANNLYSAYDAKIWKPDPGLYLHAAKEMGFSPENCIVVDDGLVGVEAGYKAGMTTFFYNRFNEHCEFADVISFESMLDLPTLLNEIK